MKIRIGLLGFGTVGSGVYKILTSRSKYIKNMTGCDIVIKKILVRNIEKPRKVNYIGSLLTTDVEKILNDDEIDIIIEAMGGIEPAYDYVKRAIISGKHVITANKELIAKHGEELYKLAKEMGVQLKYEASVAGAIPVIHQLEKLKVTDNIYYICGIINGSTNYILTQMSKRGIGFREALLEAQYLGYTEINPDFDIKGYDMLYKLVILIRKAFGFTIPISSVYRKGIEDIGHEDIYYAKEFGYEVKFIAWARNIDGCIYAGVEPVLLEEANILAQVSDVKNGVIIRGDSFGEYIFVGRGAGQLATGDAVVSDLLDILMNYGINENDITETNCVYNDEDMDTFYIRLKVDHNIQLKDIERLFSNNGIVVNSIYENNNFIVIFRLKGYGIDSFIEKLNSNMGLTVKNFFKILKDETETENLDLRSKVV